MPLRREGPPADGIKVLWWANGVDLCERLQEFVAEIRGTTLTADQVADQLNELLTNPGPRSHLPPLGDPPTATPRRFEDVVAGYDNVPDPGE
jgi:hypothetical protein